MNKIHSCECDNISCGKKCFPTFEEFEKRLEEYKPLTFTQLKRSAYWCLRDMVVDKKE